MGTSQRISCVLTFYREGLLNFYRTMHRPKMSNQIVVLPSPFR